MEKSSTEQRMFKKEGDSRVRPVKSYRQVKSPRGGSLPRHAPRIRPRGSQPRRATRSRPKSPTDKLKAHREAVYRGKYREVNRQVYREVYREVDQESTEAAYQERNHEVDLMVTDADFERQVNAEY